MNEVGINVLNATPKPDYLIKSIAEQGYTLEAAIADLIDNSITAEANNVQILVDTDNEPFQLFLADDGCGMSELALIDNMQFPSSDLDKERQGGDLGRFGLGMKAASFSQTRRFTVLSKEKGTDTFSGLTWDVEHLSNVGEWQLIKNSAQEVDSLLSEFYKLDEEFLNSVPDYFPNTIVIWSGLYKFENYLHEKNRREALKREIAEHTNEHLGIVFHRYMEGPNPLKIRVNNTFVEPFNPFPASQDHERIRRLEFKQKDFADDNIKLEGFILPSSSIDASKSLNNIWTTPRKSLMDMEGVYIYRADRLIIYGGWNGLIRKAPRHQLARLRVDIGNSADHLLHLNVAKSTVIIPHELIKAFEGYVQELTKEAEKEFFNRGIKRFDKKRKDEKSTLFTKTHSNKGPLLEINPDYPLMKDLFDSLNSKQQGQLLLINRMINTSINKIRSTHQPKPYYACMETHENDLLDTISKLTDAGFGKDYIIENFLEELGVELKTIPENIISKLE